jgi:hypothetical protein
MEKAYMLKALCSEVHRPIYPEMDVERYIDR